MVLGDAIDEDFQRINNTWQPQFFGDHNACSYADRDERYRHPPTMMNDSSWCLPDDARLKTWTG
jgi:hypothetical protein